MLDHVQAFKTQAKGSNEQGSTILVSSIGEISLKGFLHPTPLPLRLPPPFVGNFQVKLKLKHDRVINLFSSQLKSSGIKSRSESE